METGIQLAGTHTSESGLSVKRGSLSAADNEMDQFKIVPHGYEQGSGGLVWVANFSAAVSQSRVWLRLEPRGSAEALAKESSCRDIPVIFDRTAEDLRYTLVKLQLLPGLHYDLSLWQLGDGDENILLARADCCGRPDSLAKGFNVWYGTCFYRPGDNRALTDALAALPAQYRPHVSFLGGDQVYLDTAYSNTGLSVIPGFSTRNFSLLALRSRAAIARKLNRVFSREYRENWRKGLSAKLSSGFHYFLAGDHEFWNDYPNPPGFLPVLWSRKVREVWERCARELFNAYQSPASGPSSEFDVGDALRFFVLDTRLQRAPGRDGCFTDERTFARLTHWLRALDRPGVLVLPAPLLTRWQFRKRSFAKSLRVRLGLGDHSLADTGQYQDLVRALHDCPQDVLILSGDVHFSRFARFELGGKKVVEVVSSPLACLPSAAASQELTPEIFPDRPTDDIRAVVDYLRPVNRDKNVDSANDSGPAKNNFVTLGFTAGAVDGDVSVQVVCWNIDGRDAKGVPLIDWQVPDLVLHRRGGTSAIPDPARAQKPETVGIE